MAKRSSKRITLAQNFIRSPRLVRLLLTESSITQSDVVFEIGAGGGIITAELAHVVHKVIAIEKDPAYAQRLRHRFQGVGNVEIVESDFLRYHIAHTDYKVFANIPYNITAGIVRKILFAQPGPSDAYLIVQKEAANKFTGFPKETQFSILAKPLYTLQVIRELRRADFDPVPRVDSVFLHIHKRSTPLLQGEDVFLFRQFVCFGFGRWKKKLKLAFKPIFTYNQWKRLSKNLRFSLNAMPTELTFEQWLGLFDFYKHGVSDTRQAWVEGIKKNFLPYI